MRKEQAVLRKIDAMHAYYGKKPGRRCGDCAHIAKNEYGQTYYKCLAYGDSKSEATDWALKWTACGLWNRELSAGHVPLVRRLKPELKQSAPVEGQMNMLEGENLQ